MQRLLVLFGFLICGTAHAKLFRNAYVSFELPPNWNCKLEGSEWVCENDFSAKTKEAIIILTAKEVGPTDTLPAYLAHLQMPRNLPGRNGVMTKSQIISVKERMISNAMWIDGMHLGSEVGPYFTRYLATIKDRIAILVTFSAHKEHYTKYSNDFIKAIESLRVVATKDLINSTRGQDLTNTANPNGGQFGPGGGPSLLTLGSDEGAPATGGGKTKGMAFLLLLAAVIGGAGYYLYIIKGARKPRKGSPPPNRPKPKAK